MSEISEQAAINCAIRRMNFSVKRWDSDEGSGLGDMCVEVTGDDFYKTRRAVSEIPLAEAIAEQAKLDAAHEIEVTDEMAHAFCDATLASDKLDRCCICLHKDARDTKHIGIGLKAVMAARKK